MATIMDKDSISISQTLSEETILSLNCKDKISLYINRQNWHTYSTPQFHPVSKLDGDSF